MRELDSRRLRSRVTGRPALERRLRRLLLAVHRYGSHRATRWEDVRWCAEALDALAPLLGPQATGGRRRPPT